MNEHDEKLGGRVSLLDPKTLTAEQQKVYAFIDEKMVPWAEKSGFKAKLPDGRLIGPFNPIMLSPEMGEAFLKLQEVEGANTTLSQRVRQVVILTVGAVWRSDYERYAHAAVSRGLKFSEAAIQALSQGEAPDELSPDEKTAQRFTRALTREHRVEASIFDAAKAAFSDRGIAEIVVLAGCYDIVSSLLNAFEIPTPE